MAKLLSEKFVQDAIIEYLFRKGWSMNLRAKGQKEHDVDIKVRNNKCRRYWLIEVKGDASKRAKYPHAHIQVNFNLALGQIISRMHSSGTRGYKYRYKYGVGFPISFMKKVLGYLPYDVCDKLNLYVFFVDSNKTVEVYDWRRIRDEEANK